MYVFKNPIRFSRSEAHVREQLTSEPFHFGSMTVPPQPPPLVRTFFWNWLLLLPVGGDSTIAGATVESEGVSGGQRTDLVAEMAPSLSLSAACEERNSARDILAPGTS